MHPPPPPFIHMESYFSFGKQGRKNAGSSDSTVRLQYNGKEQPSSSWGNCGSKMQEDLFRKKYELRKAGKLLPMDPLSIFSVL